MVGQAGAEQALSQWVWVGLVPATLALGIGAVLRRWLPANPFVYTLGRGFLGTAAAVFLKGATVEALAERCAPLDAGQWALVPAAAGGVGQLLVQWLTARGVRVIATVGSADKVPLASAAGAELVFLSGAPDLVANVREATGGAGVAVA